MKYVSIANTKTSCFQFELTYLQDSSTECKTKPSTASGFAELVAIKTAIASVEELTHFEDVEEDAKSVGQYSHTVMEGT